MRRSAALLHSSFVSLPTFNRENLGRDLDARGEYVEFLCDAGIPVVSPLGTRGHLYLLMPRRDFCQLPPSRQTSGAWN